MSSPPHACRRGENNPTFTGVHMTKDTYSFASSPSPNASREHADVPTSVVDEEVMWGGGGMRPFYRAGR